MNMKCLSGNNNILDRCIVAYLFFWLFCFIFNLIIPARSIMALPVLNLWYSLLGVMGVGLVAADLFTKRMIFQTKYFKLLVVLFIIICISALLNIKYGMIDNIKAIMWYVIQVVLLYSLYLRFPKEILLRYFRIVFHVFLTVWTISVVIALVQYLFLISYDVVIDGIAYHQGIFESRVFGIFRSVSYGPLYSLFLLLGVGYFWKLTDRKSLQIYYLFCALFLFLYIILSGSRTVMLSAYITVFFYAFFFYRKYFTNKGVGHKKLFAVTVMISLLCCLGAILLCSGASNILGKCPAFVSALAESNFVEDKKNNSDLDSETELASADESPEKDKKESELKRDDVSMENISNNRFAIWRDYIDIGMDHFLFGLSLRNDVPLIVEQYSDYYIVEYYKEKNPESFAQGKIYGTHNNFVNVFVQCGILGLIVLLVFLILLIKDIVCFYLRHIDIDGFFLLLTAILGNILVFLMFESEVFFEASSLSVIFWVVIGFIHKEIDEDEILLKETDAD